MIQAGDFGIAKATYGASTFAAVVCLALMLNDAEFLANKSQRFDDMSQPHSKAPHIHEQKFFTAASWMQCLEVKEEAVMFCIRNTLQKGSA